MIFIKQSLFIVLMLFFLYITGCSYIDSKSDFFTYSQPKQDSIGRYYDFDDIQVPINLKLNKDRSVLFKVDNLKAGILFFSNNLERESLVNFFIDSMARDNWVLKSSFKYPRIILFFAKQFKTCVIEITEHIFSTDVEILVAPAV